MTQPGNNDHRAEMLLALLLAAVFCLMGCTEPHAARVATRLLDPVSALDRVEGDPVALAGMKSIAILPFENLAPENDFDPMKFSQKIAGQLSSRGEVRVIFPQETMRQLEAYNKEVEIHNRQLHKLMLLGKPAAEERRDRADLGQTTVSTDEAESWRKLDPVGRVEDALKLGRMMKVDGIMMGRVTDYDPYYRPRLAVSCQVVLTGRSDAATRALRELSQWGVPRSLASQRGVAWLRQQNFDTRDGGIARDLYLYARNKHTESNPYDTEIYLRSMDRFFEFVGATLACKMLEVRDDAIDEMLARGRREAKRRRMEETAVVDRIRALTRRDELPAGRDIITKNLSDRRDRSWRPDTPSSAGSRKDGRPRARAMAPAENDFRRGRSEEKKARSWKFWRW